MLEKGHFLTVSFLILPYFVMVGKVSISVPTVSVVIYWIERINHSQPLSHNAGECQLIRK